MRRRIVTISAVLLATAFLFGCVTDNRKPLSPVWRNTSRLDKDEVNEQKLRAMVPLGTPRAEVQSFLTKNLWKRPHVHERWGNVKTGNPLIVGDLWTTYVFFGQWETGGWFFFDGRGRLETIRVMTAGTFL